MIQLTVVTPERKLIDQPVDEVVLPGRQGYFGVLDGHAPLLTSLKVGQIEYRTGTEVGYLAVAWGFAEVLPDRVSVLADVAERAEDIDVERARRSRERAEGRLESGDTDWDRARASLERAVVRIQVSQKRR